MIANGNVDIGSDGNVDIGNDVNVVDSDCFVQNNVDDSSFIKQKQKNGNHRSNIF